jgi:hypothetical protein
MDWSMRVNMTVLGICIVDTWLIYKGCLGERCDLEQRKFYSVLAEQLIENQYDYYGIRPRQSVAQDSEAYEHGQPRIGIDAHLTPTKRKRKTKDALTSH